VLGLKACATTPGFFIVLLWELFKKKQKQKQKKNLALPTLATLSLGGLAGHTMVGNG
jgi:hypothetical protein